MKIFLILLLSVVSCSTNKLNIPANKLQDFDELQRLCQCYSPSPINQGSIATITIVCNSEVITWETRVPDEAVPLESQGRISSQVTTLIGDIDLGVLWQGTKQAPVEIGCQSAHEVFKTKTRDIQMTCSEFLQFPDENALAAFCAIALATIAPISMDTGTVRTTCNDPQPPEDECIPCGPANKCNWCHGADIMCLNENQILNDHNQHDTDHWTTQAEWENGECTD